MTCTCAAIGEDDARNMNLGGVGTGFSRSWEFVTSRLRRPLSTTTNNRRSRGRPFFLQVLGGLPLFLFVLAYPAMPIAIATTSEQPTLKPQERLTALLNEQPRVDWNQVGALLAEGEARRTMKVNTKSILERVVTKACRDPMVPRPIWRKILQQALRGGNTTANNSCVEPQIQWILTAVRCQNLTAVQALTEPECNPHVVELLLYWKAAFRYHNTLLHLVCEKCGWNDEIAHIVQATLLLLQQQQNAEQQDHSVLFATNTRGQTPLRLALQAGGNLDQIIRHLQTHHTDFLERYIYIHIPPLVAEYCPEMTLWNDLNQAYPSLLYPEKMGTNKPCSVALVEACLYQNQAMIRSLLQTYSSKKERQRKLTSRLTTVRDDRKSPLGYLLNSLGNMDAGNALDCVRICLAFVPNLPLLHYCVETLGDSLMEQKTLQKAICCIVERLIVDLRTLHHGKPVLIVLLCQLASKPNDEKEQEGLRALEYILSHCPETTMQKDSCKRLALHVACEYGMQWDKGIQLLVQTKVCTLQEVDPKSKLLPFCLAATAPTTSLNTIYELVRRDPGVL